MEVTGHVLRLTDVREDEAPDVRVALPSDHQLRDRDPESFLEDVTSTGPDAVTADVRVMDRRPEVSNDIVVVPDRAQHRDVEELTSRLVGIVGHEHVAGLDPVTRILVEDIAGRDGEGVDVPRRAGDRLGDHAAFPVEERVGEIAGLAHDGTERRSLQRLRLLVHRVDEARPENLQLDRVHQTISLVATIDPSSVTAASQRGRRTIVVSRSCTTAGPSMTSPERNDARS